MVAIYKILTALDEFDCKDKGTEIAPKDLRAYQYKYQNINMRYNLYPCVNTNPT